LTFSGGADKPSVQSYSIASVGVEGVPPHFNPTFGGKGLSVGSVQHLHLSFHLAKAENRPKTLFS
jgi:hypothetical protein